MAGKTKLQIINYALSHISQKPISVLGEGSPQDDAAATIWDISLEFALRGHDWAFATVILPLTAISSTLFDPTPMQFLYAYTYPANCVVLWHVYSEGTTQQNLGETFREVYDSVNNVKVIMANIGGDETAYAEYTYLVTDTTLFDTTFTEAFSHVLAANLAVQLDGDQEMAKSQLAIWNTLNSEAERMSAYENNIIKADNNPFVDAR